MKQRAHTPGKNLKTPFIHFLLQALTFNFTSQNPKSNSKSESKHRSKDKSNDKDIGSDSLSKYLSDTTYTSPGYRSGGTTARLSPRHLTLLTGFLLQGRQNTRRWLKLGNVLEKLSRGMKNVQDDEQDMKWFSDSTSLLGTYSNSEGVFEGLVFVCLHCCTNRGMIMNQNHCTHFKLFSKISLREKVYSKHFNRLVGSIV